MRLMLVPILRSARPLALGKQTMQRLKRVARGGPGRALGASPAPGFHRVCKRFGGILISRPRLRPLDGFLREISGCRSQRRERGELAIDVRDLRGREKRRRGDPGWIDQRQQMRVGNPPLRAVRGKAAPEVPAEHVIELTSRLTALRYLVVLKAPDAGAQP